MSEESAVEKLQRFTREIETQKVVKHERLLKIKKEHYIVEVITR